jgi:hypothetical protein
MKDLIRSEPVVAIAAPIHLALNTRSLKRRTMLGMAVAVLGWLGISGARGADLILIQGQGDGVVIEPRQPCECLSGKVGHVETAGAIRWRPNGKSASGTQRNPESTEHVSSTAVLRASSP